jgi:hypothetical protein
MNFFYRMDLYLGQKNYVQRVYKLYAFIYELKNKKNEFYFFYLYIN